MDDEMLTSFLLSVATTRQNVAMHGGRVHRLAINPDDYSMLNAMAVAYLAENGHRLAPRHVGDVIPNFIGIPVLLSNRIERGIFHVGEWQPGELGGTDDL